MTGRRVNARTVSTAARVLLFVFGVAVSSLSVVLAAIGELPWAAMALMVGGGATGVVRVWSRRSPLPFPS